MASVLRVVALGGLGEVGMNCLALEQDGEVMIIDCGVTFDSRGLGIDVVHSDFSALEPFRIAGVFITHGHEDHIGALPYFLQRFDVPVWVPPYAHALLRSRRAEHEVLQHARFIETRVGTRYAVGPFEVEPIRVTHSIADATALAVRTCAGIVVHSGDFKFDETPSDGEPFDVDRMRALGDEGVSLLLSDSTSVDAPGTTASEAVVAEALERVVSSAERRVIVALFASNVHRMRALAKIATRTGRRIIVAGRSVDRHIDAAHDSGYLDWPSDLTWPMSRARELEPSRMLVIAGGTQAEPNGALARMARGEHDVLIEAGDLVIFSSRVIPGNDAGVFQLMGQLIRRGVVLHNWLTDRDIHVSGHAYRDEQARLIELLRPKAFVPVHGTLHHLVRHAALAQGLGTSSTVVAANGDVVVLEDGNVSIRDRWSVGRVHIANGRPVPPSVLKERASLAAEGVVSVVIVGDELFVTSRGVALADIDRITELARDAGRRALCGARDESQVSGAVRLAVRRVFGEATGSKPTTLVMIARPATKPG